MTAPFSAPDKHPLSGRPPNAELYNRPTLIAAIAASVGVIVGSLAPWAHAFVFSLGGLDAGYLGKATLTLGAVSSVALLIELAWAHTPFNSRWAVPVAWAVAVVGVACLTIALPVVIRLLTSPKESFFGLPVGPEVGWGLWLLTVSSAVLCVTAAIVATQIAKNIELLQPPGQSTTSWANGWRWVAIVASAVIAIAGTAYFSYNWEDKSLGSGPSPSEPPSYPSFPSFPTLGTTPATTTEPPSPTRRPQVPAPATPPSAPPATGTPTPRVSLPGTDGQGWVGSYARCDPGNPPVLMGKTPKSLMVVCQAGPRNYYYRGVRLSDGAHIELPNAVRTSGGFDVTNPADGLRYQMRPNALTMIGSGGQVESEPMVQYVSS